MTYIEMFNALGFAGLVTLRNKISPQYYIVFWYIPDNSLYKIFKANNV